MELGLVLVGVLQVANTLLLLAIWGSLAHVHADLKMMRQRDPK